MCDQRSGSYAKKGKEEVVIFVNIPGVEIFTSPLNQFSFVIGSDQKICIFQFFFILFLVFLVQERMFLLSVSIIICKISCRMHWSIVCCILCLSVGCCLAYSTSFKDSWTSGLIQGWMFHQALHHDMNMHAFPCVLKVLSCLHSGYSLKMNTGMTNWHSLGGKIAAFGV